MLYKTGSTRYTCAQRTKVPFAFITPHNMCKLTLTRSKLRPDSSIARQSTYRAGEDRCADKHTAQTAQTRERRRLTTPKTHNLPRYSHTKAKQTVCTPQDERKSKPLRIADNTSKIRTHNSEQLPNRRRNGSHPNQPHNRQNSPLDDRRLSRPPQNDRVCFTSNTLILSA